VRIRREKLQLLQGKEKVNSLVHRLFFQCLNVFQNPSSWRIYKPWVPAVNKKKLRSVPNVVFPISKPRKTRSVGYFCIGCVLTNAARNRISISSSKHSNAVASCRNDHLRDAHKGSPSPSTKDSRAKRITVPLDGCCAGTLCKCVSPPGFAQLL